MKDYFDEAAERLLGDLRNLEIAFLEEEITAAEEERRRHRLIMEFLQNEFRIIFPRGETFEALARRLVTAMQGCEFFPIDPDAWDFKNEELRQTFVSAFLREELSVAHS